MPSPTRDGATGGAVGGRADPTVPSQQQQQQHLNHAHTNNYAFIPVTTNNSSAATSANASTTTHASSSNINASASMPPPLPPLDSTTDVETTTTNNSNTSTSSINDRNVVIGNVARTMTASVPPSDERGTTPIGTTSRKTKKGSKKSSNSNDSTNKKQTIGVRKRCYVERQHLQYMIDVDQPGYNLIELNASKHFRFYGTVLGSVSKNMYSIRFDLLPTDHNTYNITRNNISVLAKGEEEPPYTHVGKEEEDILEECAGVPSGNKGGKKKRSDYEKESVNEFKALPNDTKKVATTFKYKFGPNNDQCINWKILGENEQITTDPMNLDLSQGSEEPDKDEGEGSGTFWSASGSNRAANTPIYNPMKDDDIEWDPDPSKVDYNEILLKHFFPSVKGKAKVLDRFLRNKGRRSWRKRIERDNIVFNRPDAEDPDELVSNDLILMSCMCTYSTTNVCQLLLSIIYTIRRSSYA